MKSKRINLILFILSSISLIISVKLFWNMGIYVDEYNTSPNIVYGSDFWLLMSWLRLFILGVLTLIFLIKLFDQEKD